MSCERLIKKLFAEFCSEIQRNPEFRSRVERVLDGNLQTAQTTSLKRRGRRKHATLDPFAVIRDGEARLREQLASLSLEELKDILAEYGMDQGKKYMKIRTAATLVERIVEVSISRNEKGNAFR